MPELDSDLFQWLTLGLLGLAVLVLLLALLALGRIRRAIERNASIAESIAQSLTRRERSSAEARPQRDMESSFGNTAQRRAVAVDEGPEAQRSNDHKAAEERHRPAASTATSPPVEASGSAGVLDTGAYLRAQSSRRATESQSTGPTETHGPAAVTHGEDADDETLERAAVPPRNEPEEQPFERDGRWWFRRAGELLVYDERTGQWGAAPEEDPSQTVVSPAVAAFPGDAGESRAPSAHDSGDATTVTPVRRANADQEPADQGSFWKCRSCGAINDRAATSCRMCFTPKGLA